MKSVPKRAELRIAGFGGQGVVLSGAIIGKAASVFDKGYATLTQSYGPEARGGSCTAEVVISTEPVDYPYVTSPQVVVILAQEAFGNYGRNLPVETQLIIDPDLVTADGEAKSRALGIPASRLAREMKRPVVANIIVLGFLAAVTDLVTHKALRDSVLASVPQGTEEVNLKAFDLGYNYGLELRRRGNGAAG